MNGKEIFQMFVDYLNSINFNFDTDEDHLVIHFTAQGNDLPQPTIIQIIEERTVIRILSPIPGDIPEDKRVETAIAVASANDHMLNGRFDFNMERGKLVFNLVQFYGDMDITETVIRYMFSVVFGSTDKYNDRFFMLGKGMMSLEDFLNKENEG